MTSPDNATEWLTVAEAARIYGVAERTIRRRIARGELENRQVEIPQGFEWRVKAPGHATGQQDAPTAARTAGSPQSGAVEPPTAMIASAFLALQSNYQALQDELARTRQQVDELHAARLADAKNAAEQAGELREEIGRLRGLLEAAQGARQVEPAIIEQPAPVERRFRWPWQR